ncbi:hypothetical protein L1887_01751 [Cichorium endivia]|nr:hypothetical protein L1887_01751 [Cichorium endivia]
MHFFEGYTIHHFIPRDVGKSSGRIVLGVVLAPVFIALWISIGRKMQDEAPRAIDEVWKFDATPGVDPAWETRVARVVGSNPSGGEPGRLGDQKWNSARSLIRQQEYCDFSNIGMLHLDLND